MLAATAAPAPAAMITWEWGGTVTSVDDPHGVLDGLVAVGDPFTGTYTFDSETPDASPDPTFAFYSGEHHVSVFNVGQLSLSSTGDANGIGIWHRPSELSLISAGLGGGVLLDGFLVDELYVILRDYDGAALSSTELPVFPPELSYFEDKQLEFLGERLGDDFLVMGNVDYFVPEPGTSTLSLLLFNLGFWLRPSPGGSQTQKTLT